MGSQVAAPACQGRDPRLFDSTAPREHLQAREVCVTCPLVRDCIRQALTIAGETSTHSRRGPDGTWGGLLWRSGRVVDPYRAHTWVAA